MRAINPKTFIRTLSQAPGVYQMIDGDGRTLYVGKARNLKRRLASYFRTAGIPPKTAAMMRHVVNIEVIVTHTENEALLLESNLIKKHRPRFNVVLRDDKSYPYIHLDDSHTFARLGFYRGNRSEPGRFFGPYANAGAVRETLSQLQKVFPVRQCEDTFFRSRSRPCLQYQIKRCSAPCVGLVNKTDYTEDVNQAVLFLTGKDRTLNAFLQQKMEAAAEALDFETAAVYRDRIAALRRVQEHQYVSVGAGDVDIIAVAEQPGVTCAEIVFVRGGWHSGSKSFVQPNQLDLAQPEVLTTFLAQFYLDKSVPEQIVVRPAPAQARLLVKSLSELRGKRVRLVSNPRGVRLRWLEMAVLNAEDQLRRYIAGRTGLSRQIEALQQALGLDQLPARIECFDVSHTAGEAPVASCVVFDRDGAAKPDYRRYSIKDVAPGDDYAALKQVLMRRYRRVKEGEGKIPDVIVVDGGRGQLTSAKAVINELQIDGVMLLGVAKGKARKPGQEKLFISGQSRATILPPDSPALHLVQQIRDEAHRFAISGHRRQRGKGRAQSILQEVPGVGERRRRALLRHLGGLQEIARAGVEDLSMVPGISPNLAKRIYAYFHNGI